jgi:hypothetical protein
VAAVPSGLSLTALIIIIIINSYVAEIRTMHSINASQPPHGDPTLYFSTCRQRSLCLKTIRGTGSAGSSFWTSFFKLHITYSYVEPNEVGSLRLHKNLNVRDKIFAFSFAPRDKVLTVFPPLISYISRVSQPDLTRSRKERK